MRELIKNYPKIEFFELSWWFLRLERVCLVREGVGEDVLVF